jgi:hypothetical protein
MSLYRHIPEQESALVRLEVIGFIEALGSHIPTEDFLDIIQSSYHNLFTNMNYKPVRNITTV